MQHFVPRLAGALAAAMATTAAQAQIGLPQLPPTGSVQQLYGLIDLGFDRTIHAGRDAQSRIQSGQQTGSHWGLRGQEELGGAWYAAYNLEAGINADTGSSISATAFFDRRAIVGLRGPAGALLFGRQPDFTEWLNPLTTNRLAGNIALGVHGLAASGQSNRVNVVRVDNSVRFDSARWNGLSAGLWGSLSEKSPAWNGKAVSAGVRYDGVAFQAMLLGYRFTGDDGQWNGSNAPVVNALPNGLRKTDRIWGVGASYAFEAARLSTVFTDQRNALAALSPHTRVSDINVTVPLGLWIIGAGWQKQTVDWSDRRPRDGYSQFSAGVQYVFSKRTLAYMHAAAMRTTAGDFARLGATSTASSTDRQGGYRLGLRHIF
jgi:predicted porin